MSLFSSLTTSARSLEAQRMGLEVTGQNIANVNTPGFSRRVGAGRGLVREPGWWPAAPPRPAPWWAGHPVAVPISRRVATIAPPAASAAA